MRKRASFTVLELIVVIAVIGLLTSIVAPVLVKAKRGALVTASVQKMRNLFETIEIYRDQNEGLLNDWSSGHALGLPSFEYYFYEMVQKEPLEWVSPFGTDVTILNSGLEGSPGYISYAGYGYSPPFSEVIGSPFYGFLVLYQENAVLLLDQYVNNKGTLMTAPLTRKRALAILLSGQLINSTRLGNAATPHFYSGVSK